MDRLFIDTAGWMAMADAKDPLFKKSVQFRDRSLDDGTVLVTTNFVLDETLTLIRMRLGIEAAEKWWGIVSESPRCLVEWISSERFEKALHLFFRWRDQKFSFTDCTSFVLMRELNIKHALTSDKHFVIAGFQTFP
jgi:predicted nucleic acid-binding protein